MVFKNRTAAGKLLAQQLIQYAHLSGVVLAIPRGGVPVAKEVAAALDFPLDLVLAKKIGHPANHEYAIGAASLDDYFVLPHEGVSDKYIQDELVNVRRRLQEMNTLFLHNKMPLPLRNKIVIVVDDGVATGNTLKVTLQLIRKQLPAKLIVAVPVASRAAYEKLTNEADAVVALLRPLDFLGISAFYEDFHPIDDEEVESILHQKVNNTFI